MQSFYYGNAGNPTQSVMSFFIPNNIHIMKEFFPEIKNSDDSIHFAFPDQKYLRMN